MLKERTAWKEATRIFILSRLVIVLVTYIVTATIPVYGQTAIHNCARNMQSCLLSWFHWDAVIYAKVASQGYILTRDTVFFPLWPLLIHFVGSLFGGTTTAYYVASLLLANLCFYFVLLLFYCLLSEDFEPTIARNALFYLAFYPYSLFYFAGYSEALFLLLCLAFFIVLRRGRSVDWWLAGLFGFLAVLTRPTGIMLVIPFLVLYMQRFWLSKQHDQSSWWQKVNALMPIVLIPLGVVTYMIYLGYTKGNPMAFSTEESRSWSRHLSLPWNGIISTLRVLLFTSTRLQVLNFMDLVFTLVPIIVLVLGWRRLPLHYSLFALAMVLFSLSYPFTPLEPLSATPRYMMTIFPIIVILACWGKHSSSDRAYVAFSLPLFAFNVALFVRHYWVA
jgi:hypothetical protein